MGGIIFFERYTEKALPLDVSEAPTPSTEMQPLEPAGLPRARSVLLGLSAVMSSLALFFLLRGYSWKSLCRERSFGMLIVLGTLVLPQLSAFPVSWIGKLLNDPVNWSIPTNASQVTALSLTNVTNIALLVVPMSVVSVIIGLLWNRRERLINAGIWYGLFTLIYTSNFTNGAGFFTGLVGSLGYWLQQQPVQRGSQPWYYYGAAVLIWTNHRLALPAAVATFSFHAVVMLALQTVYRGIVAPDSIQAMTLRLIVWAIILGFIFAGSRLKPAAGKPDPARVLRPR